MWLLEYARLEKCDRICACVYLYISLNLLTRNNLEYRFEWLFLLL